MSVQELNREDQSNTRGVMGTHASPLTRTHPVAPEAEDANADEVLPIARLTGCGMAGEYGALDYYRRSARPANCLTGDGA